MVKKVAQQTDANQECKALLLDRTARMTARPELKIQADDVKVTHGAALSTTIDPKQFLYLIFREDFTPGRTFVQLYFRGVAASLGTGALRCEDINLAHPAKNAIAICNNSRNCHIANIVYLTE
ncbi:hypothetical protein FOZ62_017803 [Perkinsus olseni]|uniref:SUF system FeS cluster assembly SufBD core domain-containing protein n=2 Tax=Perkinsus olseni TaxID=32597 RepID=A0A7J6T707_PEROL|nr:hypothetical protein FOZ62_017803 [Perkinsus olseni]